ncbi:FUSC family protein [Pseudoclavibacter terrae]|uniref:FUSC family protein n=1 Tax=Pseudoclavibacter terrae TaxID=1530195 RepID=A0A7J5B713_9MICO|nr:FUSC family protein [Pseudoclavibacter terrae]KAB1639451.1 FUSC family protein [Pseudoclavibacter terrae]
MAAPAVGVGAALARVRASLPAVVQITAAAFVAYAIAHWGLGHPIPFLAVTVAITSLGLQRDARPRRVFDTALGITFGVLLSNLSLVLFGRGVWQVAVVLAVVLLLGRLVHPSPGFAIGAAVQASLVQLIPVQGVAEYSRLLDAVIGGAVAIAATALVPRNAAALAKNEAKGLIGALAQALGDISQALRRGDSDAGLAALEELRRTQDTLDAWSTELESAASIARLSPFMRHHRGRVDRLVELRTSIDLATRNLRVLARRAWSLSWDGRHREELADLLGDIQSGMLELRLGLDDDAMLHQSRQTLLIAAARLEPDHLHGAQLADSVLLMQCRPLVVDLLIASGMDPEAARTALPEVK